VGGARCFRGYGRLFGDFMGNILTFLLWYGSIEEERCCMRFLKNAKR
jgi:hypothetical protein